VCGIIGYVGSREIRPLLLAGLEKLEYRGYDSAGVSVFDDGRIDVVRAVGNLSHLRGALADRSRQDLAVTPAERRETAAGIGHTRWATHGRVTEANAHPHFDTTERIHIVVNGIVENYLSLKRRLIAGGARFTSETDAEVIAHLIAAHDRGDLVAAVRAAYRELRGHYAFVAMSAGQPGLLVAARRECPLVVGRGDCEQFIASAMPAFLEHTRTVQYVGDDELVAMTADDVEFVTVAGEPVEHALDEVTWDAGAAEKQGHETFMMKEIHEQAEVVADTLAGRVAPGAGVDLGHLGPGIDDDVLRSVRRITIVGCGTAYHAGLVGRYAIESWARVPVEVDIASEYRYREPAIGSDELVIGVSQSGETADTLAAMRSARRLGAPVLAITNVPDSQATRDADGVLHTRAGLEIGVAATKTFVSQMVAMYLLALRLAELRGTLSGPQLAEAIVELERLPQRVADMLEQRQEEVAAIAERHHDAEFFLYLGRHVGLPIALEGALKLKEISYVAADAYPAGEMKHGPIALLAPGTPVIAVATDSPVLDKALSNLQEVKARGAHVIAVAGDGNDEIAAHADDVIRVPAAHWMLAPLLAVIPLQLLAYHTARLRGLNVDQPRNLAKTVTVE
jgi:glucosamine--fructose-6-phosphate aminotransferase (isomerizing)